MGKKKEKSFDVQTRNLVPLGDHSRNPKKHAETVEEMSDFKYYRQLSARGGIKDLRLIPRIKEYIDNTKEGRKKITIYTIVDHLLNKYPEYGRKKRNMFSQYVEKAYAVLKQGGKLGSSTTDDLPSLQEDISSESDAEVLVEYKDTNAMNNMMSDMYRNSPRPSTEEDSLDFDVLEDKKRRPDPPHSANKKIKMDKIGSLGKNVQLLSEPDQIIDQAQGFFIDRNGKTSNVGGNPVYIEQLKTKSLGSKVDYPKRESLMEQPFELVYSSTPGSAKQMTSKPGCIPATCDRSVSSHVEQTSVMEQDKPTGNQLSKENIGDTPKKKRTNKFTKKSKEGNDSGESEREKEGPAIQKSSLSFKDVGGNEKNLEEICKLLVHMRHPEVYLKLGITPPRGFLLHGPPGCGKTLLANAIAGELDLPLIKLAATELVSGVSGDSEEKIRDLFEKAVQCSPCVVFIDEVDAITPKRETASKDMERRIVAQLLSCLDDLNANLDAQVLVIGATNRPDSLDPALRRAGRFDREICLGIPDESARLRILRVLCRSLRLSPDFDFPFLARNSPGFVGADLMALIREAAMCAVNRVFQTLQSQVKYCTASSQELTQNMDSALQSTSPMETCDIIIQDGTGVSNTVTLESQTAVHNTSTEIKTADISTNTVTKECIENVDTSTNVKTQINTNISNTAIAETNQIKVMDLHDVSQGNVTQVSVCDVSMDTSVDTQTQTVVAQCSLEPSGSNTSTVDTGLIKSVSKYDDSSKERTNTEGQVLVLNSDEKPQENVKDKFLSILCWLKEQPPLTETELSDLYITMEDFKEALHHVQPSAKREGFATVPDVTWADIGALHSVREELQIAILAPVRHAEEFRSLGLNRAQGILLAGPPGCGKTLLAKAVANESGINFISVKGPELLNMYVGESEKAVRTVFQRARHSSPCVIFFDELDALCPRRSGTADSGSSSRVVNQLLTEMDGLEERKQVFIMAATNRPDIIDPAILRPGRLDKTLYVGFPTQEDRLDILKCLTKNGTQPCLGEDVDLVKLAGEPKCDRFTGADLAALVREASVLALREAIQDKDRQPGTTIIVKEDHFDRAFRKIKPSVSVEDQKKYKAMGDSADSTN